MGITEVFMVAIGLSMDAFAVAICKGLSVNKIKPRHLLITGLYFGIFQALMPLIGSFLGASFKGFVESVDYIISFVLLAVIGVNMIREALKDEEECLDDSFSFKSMLPMAVATSIDALIIGLDPKFSQTTIGVGRAVLIIGATTFILSAIGVSVCHLVNNKFKNKAEILGGVILILLGLKTLLEGLGVLKLSFIL